MSVGLKYCVGDFVILFPQSKSFSRVGFIYDEIIPNDRYLIYEDEEIEEHTIHNFVNYEELLDMYKRNILKRNEVTNRIEK